MANTDSSQDLIQGIERLVREHIAATRTSARIAMERAQAGERLDVEQRRRGGAESPESPAQAPRSRGRHHSQA
jgi:hypothetical protein